MLLRRSPTLPHMVSAGAPSQLMEAAFARGSSTSSAARARSSSDSTMFSCAAGSDIVDADSAVSPDKRCLDLRPAPSPGGRSESTARADKVDLTITPGDVRLRRILSC